MHTDTRPHALSPLYSMNWWRLIRQGHECGGQLLHHVPCEEWCILGQGTLCTAIHQQCITFRSGNGCRCNSTESKSRHLYYTICPTNSSIHIYNKTELMSRLSHTYARVEHSRNSKRFKNSHTEENARLWTWQLLQKTMLMVGSSATEPKLSKTKIKIQLKMKI